MFDGCTARLVGWQNSESLEADLVTQGRQKGYGIIVLCSACVAL